MFQSIFDFIEKHVDKTFLLIIIGILLGAGALYHIDDIVVTEKVFGQEIDRVYRQMNRTYSQSRLDTLLLQRRLTEKQIWDIDARIDDIPIDSPNKKKWIRRLERAEYELKCIDKQIEVLKEKILMLKHNAHPNDYEMDTDDE